MINYYNHLIISLTKIITLAYRETHKHIIIERPSNDSSVNSLRNARQAFSSRAMT
jgi:hypothetical protein